MDIDELIENFELFDDWEDRYRYIIDLGKKLPPMDDADKTDQTKVDGCMSNVWLIGEPSAATPPTLSFTVDSDAFIVKGLSSILVTIYSGKTPQEILSIDANAIFAKLGLDSHLSPTRANGLYAMVDKIRSLAKSV